MLAVEAKPRLQLITGAKNQRTIKVVPSDGVDVGQFAEKNQDKLEELRQRREQLLWKASFVGLGGAASMVIAATTVAFMLAGAAASLPSISLLLGELQTISQGRIY